MSFSTYKMRPIHFLTFTILVLGIFLAGGAVGETSVQDIEQALEEALKIVRQSQAGSDPGNATLEEETRNLVTATEELTKAVQENTETLKAMMGEGGDGGMIPGHGRCEAPFFPVKTNCYYVNKFKRVSWGEAKKFCQGLGGDLAAPDDVNTLRAKLLAKFPEDDFQVFWVGATESGGEGKWTWLSKKAVQEGEWATGQPDGGNENCVVLSRDEFPPLHDRPCYHHALFICEKAASEE